MEPNHSAAGLWSGARIGRRRWQQEHAGLDRNMKTPSTVTPTATAAQQQQQQVAQTFSPHDLQLIPGAAIEGTPLLVPNSHEYCNRSSSSSSNKSSVTISTSSGSCGGASGSSTPSRQGFSDSSSSSSYQLESELHRGPRSAVWSAADTTTGQPVVLKVLGLGPSHQQAAALHELNVMQQLSQTAAAAPADNTAAQHDLKTPLPPQQQQQQHLTRLLDAFLAHQQKKPMPPQTSSTQNPRAQPPQDLTAAQGPGLQPQQQQQQQQQRSFAAEVVREAVCDDSSAAAVVLVLPRLHQSLGWVLHFVHQRNGRKGLPPAAVRSFARQLLSALAALHDEEALVHRDVKPSNMLLQQPFVVRTGKKHLMRSLTLQELTAAQWTLVDLGNAGRLLPPALVTQQPNITPHSLSHPSDAATVTATAGQAAHSVTHTLSHQPGKQQQWHLQQQQQSPAGPLSLLGQLWGRIQGTAPLFQQPAAAAAVAAATPSGQCWQVAAQDVLGYETAAYAPPEAVLHSPATAAYDIWSAACSIYEAATGRTLFPVESAAAARRSITDRVFGPAAGVGGDESSASEDDVSTQLDEVHLAMIKGVAGTPPPKVLSSSPVARELFADTDTGRLWLSEEEEGVLELQQWRQRVSKPLLHHLMAKRNMTLQQAIDLASLLQPMLAWDPAERPTAAELLQHPYLKPLEDDDRRA